MEKKKQNPVKVSKKFMVYTDYKRNKRSFFDKFEAAMNASEQVSCSPIYFGTLYEQDGVEEPIFLVARVLQQCFIDFPKIPESMEGAKFEMV